MRRRAADVAVRAARTGRRGRGRRTLDSSPTGSAVPVRLVDERFSTVSAQRGLQASGVDTRRGRSVIDQAAAVIILQGALDAERASGVAPGRLVERGTRGAGPAAPTSAGAPERGAQDDVRGET